MFSLEIHVSFSLSVAILPEDLIGFVLQNLPTTREGLSQLLAEAEYYQIDSLCEAIRAGEGFACWIVVLTASPPFSAMDLEPR